MTRKPLGVAAWVGIAISGVMGISFLLVVTLLPSSRENFDPASNATIVMNLRPQTIESSWIFTAALLFLLIPSAILLLRRRILTGLLLAIPFPALVAAYGARPFVNYAQWTLRDEIQTSDGSRFALVELMDVDHDTRAIIQIDSSSTLYYSSHLLGRPEDHRATAAQWIVRPSPPKTVRFGAIYESPDGLLLGFSDTNMCFVAYDLHQHRYLDKDELNRLSPYVLLNNVEQPYLPDEATSIQCLGDPKCAVRPDRQSLVNALNHTNPAVRDSAKRILDSLK